LIVLALPLFFALVALVSDGSSVFANKRSLQNAADASVLAAVRELNSDLSSCGGSDTTAGTCLYRIRTTAEDYSNRNGGPTSLPACNDSLGPRWNCYKTPYPTGTDNAGLQVRFERTVPFRFGRVVGLSGGTVHAKAAAGLSLPGSANAVAPVGVQTNNACTTSSCFGQTRQLNFDIDGYRLLDLSVRSTTGPTGPGSASAQLMKGWITNGYPGLLPANAWYGDNNGQKTGVKNAFVDDGQTILLIPVFDKYCPSTAPTPPECPTPGTPPVSFHVVGFAAFVIDPGGVNWSPSTNGAHILTGHFTRYIATGVGGGGGSDFGVHVLTLNE
jgi:hypothetical protein